MNKSMLEYLIVWGNEVIGAYELLSAEKRYMKLSNNVRILSRRKTNSEIVSFFSSRAIIYRQIKIFSGFFIAFLILMTYIISGSIFFTFSISVLLVVAYKMISTLVKDERRHSSMWDNEFRFLQFLKLNKSTVFNAANFEDIIEVDSEEEEVFEERLSFEEECKLFLKQENKFNTMEMNFVIKLFSITVKDDIPSGLKKVRMKPEDCIRFIKARIIENSDEDLQISLLKGDKNHVKALIYQFFDLSYQLYGSKKKGQAKRYSNIYLKSFDLFDKEDFSNFSGNMAMDYSKAIKKYMAIED